MPLPSEERTDPALSTWPCTGHTALHRAYRLSANIGPCIEHTALHGPQGHELTPRPSLHHTALNIRPCIEAHGNASKHTALHRAHGPALSMWPRMEDAVPALDILPCIEHTALCLAYSSDLFGPNRFGPDRSVCLGQYRFTQNHFGAHNALIGPSSAPPALPPRHFREDFGPLFLGFSIEPKTQQKCS